MTFNDNVTEILRSEFRYWSDSEGKKGYDPAIEIGALGAVSNVIAAMNGHPAPWHQELPGDSNLIWPAEVKRWGRSSLGILRIRILIRAGNWRTLWCLSVGRVWLFSVAIPPALQRLFGDSK